MPPPSTASLTRRLVLAAWASIAIAIALELLLIVAAAVFGKSNDLRPFIADLAGKISWSVLVCVGIAVGMTASAARPPLMGLLGFFSAPTGFAVSKAVHKSASQALDLTLAGGGVPTAMQMVILRAVEYSLLGFAVGAISRRAGRPLPAYAGLGLATGIASAAFVLWATVSASPTPPPTLSLVSKAINEVLFPVGCSMVLYAANALGERVRIAVAA